MNPYYTHSHLIILLYIPFATHYCIQHNLGMSTLAGLFINVEIASTRLCLCLSLTQTYDIISVGLLRFVLTVPVLVTPAVKSYPTSYYNRDIP